MERGTKRLPQAAAIIGRVVSPLVAPPWLIGASGPKPRHKNGAASRTISSRRMLYISESVPSSEPRSSVMRTPDSE